jgi:hypothetical protein
MSDKDDIIRRVDDGDLEGGQRSVTGAIITGAAAGTANPTVTQTIGALKKKPKKKK